MNANIMKKQIFHEVKCDLRGHIIKDILKFRNTLFLITTLTYIVMDNFCPCFKTVIFKVTLQCLCEFCIIFDIED